jgi:hypothetical protein
MWVIDYGINQSRRFYCAGMFRQKNGDGSRLGLPPTPVHPEKLAMTGAKLVDAE